MTIFSFGEEISEINAIKEIIKPSLVTHISLEVRDNDIIASSKTKEGEQFLRELCAQGICQEISE